MATTPKKPPRPNQRTKTQFPENIGKGAATTGRKGKGIEEDSNGRNGYGGARSQGTGKTQRSN